MSARELIEDITGRRRKKAPPTVAMCRGLPRVLSNAPEFLDRLGLKARSGYGSLEEWQSVVGSVELTTLDDVRA
jgi:hypothetical protein